MSPVMNKTLAVSHCLVYTLMRIIVRNGRRKRQRSKEEGRWSYIDFRIRNDIREK